MSGFDADREALLGAVACTCCPSADVSAIVIALEARASARDGDAPRRGDASGSGRRAAAAGDRQSWKGEHE